MIKDFKLKFTNLQKRKKTEAIFIHHTAGPGTETAETIHQQHLQQGWSGCGYHYVITQSGEIQKGRPDDMVGAHCYGYNYNSVGVCLCGNFENSEPTKKQLASLREVLKMLLAKYSLWAGKIYGHRDRDATACPGENLYNLLPDLRVELMEWQDK